MAWGMFKSGVGLLLTGDVLVTIDMEDGEPPIVTLRDTSERTNVV